MRNSIASYKESLSRIAHEVLDATEEVARENGPVSARRISQPIPSQRSPHANGTDHGYNDEIARYRADIQRLQASESEIKALSFSYAALLKEKEEQLCDLHIENDLLRRSLEARKEDGCLSRDESPRTLSSNSVSPKGDWDRASIKSRKVRTQENSRTGNHALGSSVSKQNGFNYGGALKNPVEETANSELLYKEHEKLLEEVRFLKDVQAGQQAEMKMLKEQLDKERVNSSLLKIKLHEEHQLCEASHRELCNLKTDMEKVSETKALQEELDRTLSELRRLQAEVSKKNLEIEQIESVENLKSAMQRLEKEKLKITTEKNELEEKLNSFLKNNRESNDADSSDLLNASKNKPNELVNHVCFSPDGQWLASASFDKSVKLWNGITGKFVASFRGHVGPVYQISWSADCRLLLSGSKDSTLKVFSVDWSPDGEKVASGGKDRLLKLWMG